MDRIPSTTVMMIKNQLKPANTIVAGALRRQPAETLSTCDVLRLSIGSTLQYPICQTAEFACIWEQDHVMSVIKQHMHTCMCELRH